jgi:hypothetical protein
MALQSLGAPDINVDSWWLRSVIGVMNDAVVADIFDGEDKSRALAAADALLERLSANSNHGLIEVANLITAARCSSKNLDALAARGVEFVRKDLRSSALGLTLHVVMQLLPSMDATVRSDLADLLLNEAEASSADTADRSFDRGGPLAAALCELSSVESPRRAEIVAMVQRLVSGDSARYGASIDLAKLGLLDDEVKVEMALSLLMGFHEDREWTMRSKGRWLRKQSTTSSERQPVIDALIGLLISDLPQTRHAAVEAVRKVVVEILRAATSADIAIVRRCGEAALNELLRGPSPSTNVGESPPSPRSRAPLHPAPLIPTASPAGAVTYIDRHAKCGLSRREVDVATLALDSISYPPRVPRVSVGGKRKKRSGYETTSKDDDLFECVGACCCLWSDGRRLDAGERRDQLTGRWGRGPSG